jgi:hypothetical protein
MIEQAVDRRSAMEPDAVITMQIDHNQDDIDFDNMDQDLDVPEDFQDSLEDRYDSAMTVDILPRNHSLIIVI